MQEKVVGFRVTHDAEGDAAYVYLAERIGTGGSVAQVVVDDDRVAGMVILDLDVEGRILGVEILGANDLLPATLLETMRDS